MIRKALTYKETETSFPSIHQLLSCCVESLNGEQPTNKSFSYSPPPPPSALPAFLGYEDPLTLAISILILFFFLGGGGGGLQIRLNSPPFLEMGIYYITAQCNIVFHHMVWMWPRNAQIHCCFDPNELYSWARSAIWYMGDKLLDSGET